MTSLPTAAWIVIGAVSAGATLGILSVLAATAKEQIDLHDLRLEAEKIRREFLRRLQPEEPIELDEAPAEPRSKAAA
jgi:hypothetical protein